MSGPSAHLSWAELACHDAARTPYPLAWRSTRAVALAAVFEYLRARAGNRPLPVLSGYRTEAHNRAIGGARHSQHVQGRALDLKPPTGQSVAAFGRLVRVCADELRAAGAAYQIGGIGYYPTFLHVDTRPGPLVVWHGGRRRADVTGG